MRRLIVVGALLAACGKGEAPPPPSSSTPAPPVTAVAPAAPGSACPADGSWAACSIVYRLERAGLAPKLDSTATPTEKSLTGKPLLLKIGLSAKLEVYLYPDSTARKADAAKLDRKELVSGTTPQTIKRERTLIESANVIGLLTSINAHQRERVSDALMAGPPQPASPTVLPPVRGDTR
ncbi:MAG TPA: hypothetical protein VIP11_16895 [Gemmatimonadaceae bacterium]